MAKLGTKMSTILSEPESSPEDEVMYPTVYLNDDDAEILPKGASAGEEFPMMARVRVRSISSHDDGDGVKRSVDLEIIEAEIDSTEKSLKNMFPSVSKDD